MRSGAHNRIDSNSGPHYRSFCLLFSFIRSKQPIIVHFHFIIISSYTSFSAKTEQAGGYWKSTWLDIHRIGAGIHRFSIIPSFRYQIRGIDRSFNVYCHGGHLFRGLRNTRRPGEHRYRNIIDKKAEIFTVRIMTEIILLKIVICSEVDV